MDMNEYQQWTETTRLYPENFYIYYPAMELGGEAGAILNQVKKIARDDDSVLTDERREAIAKEAGDVLWSLARVLGDIGVSLSDVAYMNVDKLTKRMSNGTIQGSGDDR